MSKSERPRGSVQKALGMVALAVWLLGLGVVGCVHDRATDTVRAPTVGREQAPADPYIQWLQQHSMLRQADQLAREYSGKGVMWRHPYAAIRPRAASARASTWFTAYPAATITTKGESVIAALGNPRLWKVFSQIGIQAMHTGPMERAGGVTGHTFTPTVDGNFDRIGMAIDPSLGTEAEYHQLVARAKAAGAIVIADVIPGHTGKGPDFRLAERRYGDYPGLYHMVEIDRADWDILPPVPAGKDTVNLKPDAVDQLKAKGYIVGRLYRVIFYEPGVKESNWSATDVVKGADGKERRWVYLHYFKEGQPTLNWIEPTFAAERLVIGDALDAIGKRGVGMLRLDANGFLGIEIDPHSKTAYSEGHPLSLIGNQLIAGIARKLGAFTFQELNLSIEDIREMQNGGADLSYDFVTRPAYQDALVTGDAEFLRLMLHLMHKHHVDPATLIHALQNHDELTLELVHFWNRHKNDVYRFRGKQLTGLQLRKIIRHEMHSRLLGVPYNLKAANGVACTTASLIAAALGIKDITHLTGEQKKQIRKLHLLLAFYNTFQPGVFALSGWDLMGTLTLPKDSVKQLLADGDTRWINRGAYDLLGENPAAKASRAGLPRAVSLYGPLPEQLQQPDSFASQLKRLLQVRARYRINEARQLAVPQVKSAGLLVMVHELPDKGGIEVTAINFGRKAVRETVAIEGAKGGKTVQNLLQPTEKEDTFRAGKLALRLDPFEGKALLIQ